MGTRRKAREIALQVLFQLETGEKHSTTEESFSMFCRNFDAPADTRNFAWDLVSGVRTHLAELDKLLSQASDHWRIDRMSPVDRNILRLALFEMAYLDDIPIKVSLNEAVDLGKRYGTDESGAFINGILDHIHHNLLQSPALSLTDEAEDKAR
jgi:N utilization substance protein B